LSENFGAISQPRHIAPQFINYVWWDWHALRCILCFKALWRLEQFRLVGRRGSPSARGRRKLPDRQLNLAAIAPRRSSAKKQWTQRKLLLL
jgi:hypothetical protein